jgi:signal transduction histidine kinase
MIRAISGAAVGATAPGWTGRLRTRTALVTGLSLAYAAVLGLGVAAQLSPPPFTLALAAPTAGSARIIWVLPGGSLWEAGIRQGDLVLALDGRPPTPRDADWWSGRGVRVRTGAGEVVTLDAAAAYRGHVAWPLLLLSPWFYLLGTLVFLREPRYAAARATLALFACASFALGLAPATLQGGPLAAAGNHILVTLFPAAFLLFFLTFPTRHGGKPLYTLVLVPALVVAALSLLALARPALYDVAHLLQLSVLALYLAIGAGVSVYSFVMGGDRGERRGLAIIAGGTTLSVLPFVGLYLAPTLLGRPHLLAAEYAILPLALLPASFAYAILRHHVLGVPLLQRWLVQGLLWFGLLVPCAATLYALRGPLEALHGTMYKLLVETVLVLFVGISFGQLHSPLRRFLDRLIFKDSYDYRASLQRLSQDLSVAGDLDTLAGSLPETLRRLMNLDFAVLLVQGVRGAYARGVAGNYQPEMLPALATAAQSVQEAPDVASLAFGYLNVLLVPLRSRDAVVGHLCLGPKASGEPFRVEDHDLLVTLSGQVAAVVRNAQLVDDLSAKVLALDALNERLESAREQERARLAAEIHDEPLQSLIQLQRQLAEARGRNDATGDQVVLGRVVDQLRAVCAAMRPATLDDLGLADALAELIAREGARSRVPIWLDVAPEVISLELPPAVELALYRAAQEAIHNSLRHARPSAIHAALRLDCEQIELLVRDDGEGFRVPQSFGLLAAEGHLGLAGLRARVRRMGGQMAVSSKRGEGTMLRIVLPLSSSSP